MTSPGKPTILLVPGWGNSGPEHWQTLWRAEHPEYLRVEQRDWYAIIRDEWIAGISRAVATARRPIVIVAHSAGCLATVHWTEQYPVPARIITGALLVAPPDVGAMCDASQALRAFDPLPRRPLPFPSILAASENDHYASLRQSEEWATYWGSEFVNLGRAGHVNSASGHGPWLEGKQLLNRLLKNDETRENVA